MDRESGERGRVKVQTKNNNFAKNKECCAICWTEREEKERERGENLKESLRAIIWRTIEGSSKLAGNVEHVRLWLFTDAFGVLWFGINGRMSNGSEV